MSRKIDFDFEILTIHVHNLILAANMFDDVRQECNIFRGEGEKEGEIFIDINF